MNHTHRKNIYERFSEIKKGFLQKRAINTETCLSEKEIRAFEKKYKIILPLSYRMYIKFLSNGDNNPALVFPLNHKSVVEKGVFSFTGKRISAHCLRPIFRVPGTMLIADAGCTFCYLMVVRGRRYGSIWHYDFDWEWENEECYPLHWRADNFFDWYECRLNN